MRDSWEIGYAADILLLRELLYLPHPQKAAFWEVTFKRDEMTGLVKAKKYDWKDSNLALFGSDTERNVSSLLHSKKISKWFRFFLICVDLLGVLEIQNTARRIFIVERV